MGFARTSLADATWTQVGVSAGNSTYTWSDASNWSAGVTPAGSTSASTITFYANTATGPSNSATVTANNDLGTINLGTLTLNGVTVGSGTAATVNITGGTLNFAGTANAINLFTGYGTGAGTTFNINTPLSFAGGGTTTITLNNSGGVHNFGGALYGAGNLVLSNSITNRSIAFNSPVSGTSTYTGNIFLNKGQAQINRAPGVFGTNATGTQTFTIGTAGGSGASVVFSQNNGASTQAQEFILYGTGYQTNAAISYTGINFGSPNLGGIVAASDTAINVTGNSALNGQGLGISTGLAGTGTITLMGNDPLFLSKTAAAFGTFSAFTGNVQVNSSVLSLGKADNILGANTGSVQTVTVASGAAVLFNYGNGHQNQPQTFIINGSGTGTYAGLQVSGLAFGGANIGSLVIASNSTIDVQANGSVANGIAEQVSGALAGPGNITLTGTDPLLLTKTSAAVGTFSAFTGNVTVNSGTLEFGNADNVLGANAGSLQTVTINPNAVGWLSYGNSHASNPQTFILKSTGTGTFAGLQVSGLNFNSSSIGSLVIATNSTIDVEGNGSLANGWYLNVNGALAGSGNLSLSGTDGLKLTQAAGAVGTFSAFTGNINVNSGQLQILGADQAMGPNAAGTQTVTVASGATAIVDNGQFGGHTSQPQVFVVNGTGNGSNAALQIKDVAYFNASVGPVVIASNSTIDVQAYQGTNNGFYTGIGTLAGSGNITLTGTEALALTVPSSAVGTFSAFTGNVAVNSGTLLFAASNALGTNAVGTQSVTVSGAGVALLSGTTGVSYTEPQNFTVGANSPSPLSVARGLFTLSGTTTFSGGTTVNVTNAADSLALGATNNAGYAITKTGSGTLTFNGAQTNGVGASLTVSAGIANLNSDGGSNLAANVAGGATLNANASQTIASINSAGVTNFTSGNSTVGPIDGTGTLGVTGSTNLTATYVRHGGLSVGSGSTVTIAHDNQSATGGTPTGTSAVTTLAVNAAGTLDLTNNGIIVTDTTQFGAIQSSLATAYAAGWASPGITSSTAAAHTADHGVGYALASAIGSTSFNGITFADAVIARYTLLGDTNLKGGVDLGDYTKVITNLGKTGTVWSDGNFDYSGTVGLGDYTKVILALGRTDATTLNSTTLNATAGPSAKQVRAASSALTLKAATPAVAPAATATDVHLVVNTASGLVTLISAVSGSQAIITAYTVKSPSGSLVKFKNSGSKYLGSAFQNNPGVFYSSSNGNTYNNWTGIKNTSTIIGEGFGNNYIATNDTTWTNYTLSSGGYALGAMFKTLSAGGVQDLSFQWDDKALNTFTSVVDYVGGTVPEPTSVSLIAMGAVGLLGRRRRRCH